MESPLLDTRASLKGLNALTGDVRPNAVFLGIGLCAPGRASRGVPLDVLALLLAAEALRARIGAERIVLLLADQHAWAAGLRGACLDGIETRWHLTLERLRSVFPRLDWLSARNLHRESLHRDWCAWLLRRGLGPYEAAQVADLMTLTAMRGRLLKVGWTLRSPEPRGDERYFDRLTEPYSSGHLGFVYGPAGRALRGSQPRVAPYVALDRETRILLEPGEDVATKLGRARQSLSPSEFRATLNHYRRLTYAYRKQVPTLKGSVTERLQGIIAHALTGEARTREKRHVI